MMRSSGSNVYDEAPRIDDAVPLFSKVVYPMKNDILGFLQFLRSMLIMSFWISTLISKRAQC